jgi:hypothetical protein
LSCLRLGGGTDAFKIKRASCSHFFENPRMLHVTRGCHKRTISKVWTFLSSGGFFIRHHLLRPPLDTPPDRSPITVVFCSSQNQKFSSTLQYPVSKFDCPLLSAPLMHDQNCGRKGRATPEATGPKRKARQDSWSTATLL